MMMRKQSKLTDSNTPLHLIPPDYPFGYRIPKLEDIKKLMDKIHGFLDNVTPARIVDSKKRQITDFKEFDEYSTIEPGKFRLISYEWGLIYSAMILAGQVTNDQRFTEYATERIKLLSELYLFNAKKGNEKTVVDSLLHPASLDDSGAICASFIMALQTGIEMNLKPLIDNLITYISTKQFRLDDGTFARNRPYPNTIWLDDLFMSVSALSRMGNLTDEKIYYEDCVKQVHQFSKRMFNEEKGIYQHGWVQEMREKPAYYWGRANGWAILAKTELLDLLPLGFKGYNGVMDLLKSHISGLAAFQSGTGLWHQILDRNDTYLETSSSALFVYCIAKAVNKGWIDPLAFGPVALLGWNGLETRINDKGEVEGTCVGTGMGFDIAFYAYRPVSSSAAHGYGPVILAASEIIKMLRNFSFIMVENAIQVKPLTDK